MIQSRIRLFGIVCLLGVSYLLLIGFVAGGGNVPLNPVDIAALDATDLMASPGTIALAVGGTETAHTAKNVPTRIRIPSLSVDATIDEVGLSADGRIAVPSNPANAAWFNQSALPGEKGNAVIDGHFGWKDSTPAAFDNLHRLSQGDKIYIEDSEGESTSFVVREKRIYASDAKVPDIFNSPDDGAHVMLITCDGVWNKTTQSYPLRLVVVADREQ